MGRAKRATGQFKSREEFYRLDNPDLPEGKPTVIRGRVEKIVMLRAPAGASQEDVHQMCGSFHAQFPNEGFMVLGPGVSVIRATPITRRQAAELLVEAKRGQQKVIDKQKVDETEDDTDL